MLCTRACRAALYGVDHSRLHHILVGRRLARMAILKRCTMLRRCTRAAGARPGHKLLSGAMSCAASLCKTCS